MEKVSGFRKVGEVLKLKCPNCGVTNVFYKPKYPLIGKPQMKEVCENCGYRFDQHAGDFSGATFLSYGLAVVEGLIAFVLAKYLIYGLNAVQLALITLAGILLCAVWNYRLARVIWMNLFPKEN